MTPFQPASSKNEDPSAKFATTSQVVDAPETTSTHLGKMLFQAKGDNKHNNTNG